MMISGACLMCTCFFGKGELPGDWPIVTLAMIAKFCVNITFASIYLYTVELYPTLLRTIGLGCCSTMARLGSIVAPMTFALKEYHRRFFPTGLLGLVFLMCTLFLFLLPETRGRPLPHSVQELEEREGEECCWRPHSGKEGSDNGNGNNNRKKKGKA